jgi:hypothetical protein
MQVVLQGIDRQGMSWISVRPYGRLRAEMAVVLDAGGLVFVDSDQLAAE